MSWPYVARRIAHGLAVVVLVSVVVFFVTRVLGDPAKKMLPIGSTPEQYEQFRERLGLDRPIAAQFASFLGDTARLELGDSIWQERPARDIIFERLPNSLLLLTASMLIALAVGIPLGLIAAIRAGTWIDTTTVTSSLVALSLPQFWFGAILILLFAVTLNWLPTSGTGGIEHLVLPALALGLPIAGKVAQMTRSSVLDELQSQYALAARAKGFGQAYVMRRHVLRNTLVPLTSFLSVEAARTLAGASVVVETVFAFPGIGYLAVEALRRDDIILVQAIVLVVAILVVFSNLLFDMFQARIDPRIRLGGS